MIILGKKRYFFSAENLNNQKRDIFPKKKRGSAAILCFIFLEFLIPDFCEFSLSKSLFLKECKKDLESDTVFFARPILRAMEGEVQSGFRILGSFRGCLTQWYFFDFRVFFGGGVKYPISRYFGVLRLFGPNGFIHGRGHFPSCLGYKGVRLTRFWPLLGPQRG